MRVGVAVDVEDNGAEYRSGAVIVDSRLRPNGPKVIERFLPHFARNVDLVTSKILFPLDPEHPPQRIDRLGGRGVRQMLPRLVEPRLHDSVVVVRVPRLAVVHDAVAQTY